MLGLGTAAAPAAAHVAAPPPPPIPVPPPLPIPISPPLTFGHAAVSLSTDRAGARPVAVALRYASELRCGSPRAARLLVTFPAAEHVPAHIAPSSVLVNGRPAQAVTRNGTTVALVVAQRGGISCGVIVPGIVRIGFNLPAGIGNPAKAGMYPISVRSGTRLMLHAAFKIRP